jgi:hypothetical protein
MPAISYPTSYSLEGPWLFDVQSLESLDALVESCFEAMETKRENDLRNELVLRRDAFLAEGLLEEGVDSRLRSVESTLREIRFPAGSKGVTVYLEGKGRIEGLSFAELASLPHVHQQSPKGFEVKASSGRTTLEIGTNQWANKTFEIKVRSDDGVFADDLFGKLQAWAVEIEPARWLRVWLDYKLWGSFFLFLWCFIFAEVFFLLAAPKSGPSLVREQAYEMARHGVTQANEVQALQLLLSLESGYEPVPPPTVQHFPGVRFYLYFATGLFVLIASVNPPKGAVGLWAGKQSVKRQRNWIRFVTVSVPGTIACSVLAPMVVHFFGIPN